MNNELCKREDCGEEAVDGLYGFCSECCGRLHILEEEIKIYQRASKTYSLRMRRNDLLDLSVLVSRLRTETEEIELVQIEEELDRIHELEMPDYKNAEAMRFIREAAELLRKKDDLSIV